MYLVRVNMTDRTYQVTDVPESTVIWQGGGSHPALWRLRFRLCAIHLGRTINWCSPQGLLPERVLLPRRVAR